jgi:hypothetical protein
MTDMAFITNSRNVDDNLDITRKIKRMKLNNNQNISPPQKIPSNYFNLKDSNDLNQLFPFLGKDVFLSLT